MFRVQCSIQSNRKWKTNNMLFDYRSYVLEWIISSKKWVVASAISHILKICYHHVKIQVLHFLWVISYRIRKNTHLPLPYTDKSTSWESSYYTPNLRKFAEHAHIFIWKSTSPIKYCLKLNNVGKNMQNCQQYKITSKIQSPKY